LKEGGGELLLRTRITEVRTEGAVVSTDEGERQLAVDTVVWAVGAVSEKDMAEQAKQAGIKVLSVGDAVEPRRMLEAIDEGHNAAEKLLYDE
jgi:NADH dehydrogenase FAD-containing subunit